MGTPPPQRLRDAGAHPAALHVLETGLHLALWRGALRTRRFSRRFTALDVGRPEIYGSQFMRIFRREDLLAGKSGPLAQFHSARPFRRHSCSPGMAATCTAAPTSRAFRHLPLRNPTGDLQAVSNAGTGFFPTHPDGGRHPDRPGIHGDGFAPMIIDPKPLEDVSAITLLGTEIARKHPIVRDWSSARRRRRPGADDYAQRQVPADARARPRRQLSDCPGLSGLCPRWAGACASRTRRSSTGSTSRPAIHGTARCLPGKSRTSTCAMKYRLTLGILAQRRELLRPVRPDQRSRKGDAFLGEFNKALIYDDPRRLDLSVAAAYFNGSIPCRSTRTCRADSPSSSRARSSSPTATSAARKAPWIMKKATAGR